jgi:hypothetical protein
VKKKLHLYAVVHDAKDENCCVPRKTDWIRNGRKRDRFSEKYDTGSKGKLQNKRNPLDIYEYF